MLYWIGPLALDTRPFSIDEVQRTASADFAAKPLIGALQRREYMGEGDDKLTLSGQLLPFKIGGLDTLETVHRLRLSGAPQAVQRGDGKRLGYFVIESVSETHREIMRDGVGFFVQHSIALIKVPSETADVNQISNLLSLFDLGE
jgi:hypothetical protein